MIKSFRNSSTLKSGKLAQEEANFSNDPSSDEVKTRHWLKTEANKGSIDKKGLSFCLKN